MEILRTVAGNELIRAVATTALATDESQTVPPHHHLEMLPPTHAQILQYQTSSNCRILVEFTNPKTNKTITHLIPNASCDSTYTAQINLRETNGEKAISLESYTMSNEPSKGMIGASGLLMVLAIGSFWMAHRKNPKPS